MLIVYSMTEKPIGDIILNGVTVPAGDINPACDVIPAGDTEASSDSVTII